MLVLGELYRHRIIYRYFPSLEGMLDVQPLRRLEQANHYPRQELRESFTKHSVALGRQEDYFLDLAAEEGWPKEKLRMKIQAIRGERKDLRRTARQSRRPA